MRKINTPGLPHVSGTARTHYIISDAVYTRCAIQHDKSGLDTVHCSATKQAGALTPRLLHALSVE